MSGLGSRKTMGIKLDRLIVKASLTVFSPVQTARSVATPPVAGNDRPKGIRRSRS